MGLIDRIFNTDSDDNICKLHPDFCDQVRALMKKKNPSYDGALFDYCDSWNFARILMGWSAHEDPVHFYEVLSFVNNFFKLNYPKVFILTKGGNIEFREKSYFIDTPELNALFQKEVDAVQEDIALFDPSLFYAYREFKENLMEARSDSVDEIIKKLYIDSKSVSYSIKKNNMVFLSIIFCMYGSEKLCNEYIKTLSPYLPSNYVLQLERIERGIYFIYFLKSNINEEDK